MKMYTLGLLLVSTTALAAGKAKPPAPATASALMAAKSGSQVEGKIDFEQTDKGVKITYDLKQLPKSQTLGFHIHEKGDCSSVDAKSAGPHYAKTHDTGGTSLDFPGKYAGDLQPIASTAAGTAKGSFVAPELTMTDKNAIKDRAIIIHAGPDDISKKSAPRIACGMITTTK